MNDVDKNITRDISIDQLISLEILDKAPADLIRGLIESKKNILIAGAIGSGKTVLLQACVNELSKTSPADRVVLLQRFDEIGTSSNIVTLTGEYHNLGDLLGTALRVRPDALIIGEVSGGEVKYMLNCITPWIASIMGTSAEHALHNLEQFSTESGYCLRKSQIVEQVHNVVLIEKIGGLHKVTEISRLINWNDKQQTFEMITLWMKK